MKSVPVIAAGHQPATASRELIVNKQRRTCSKNIERSRDGLSVASFGTRGSQVQILPLRPILTSFALGHCDRFPDRNKIGLALECCRRAP